MPRRRHGSWSRLTIVSLLLEKNKKREWENKNETKEATTAARLSPTCQCWLIKVLQGHVYHKDRRQLVEGDKVLPGGTAIAGFLSAASLSCLVTRRTSSTCSVLLWYAGPTSTLFLAFDSGLYEGNRVQTADIHTQSHNHSHTQYVHIYNYIYKYMYTYRRRKPFRVSLCHAPCFCFSSGCERVTLGFYRIVFHCRMSQCCRVVFCLFSTSVKEAKLEGWSHASMYSLHVMLFSGSVGENGSR